jgi:hypothetical protein
MVGGGGGGLARLSMGGLGVQGRAARGWEDERVVKEAFLNRGVGRRRRPQDGFVRWVVWSHVCVRVCRGPPGAQAVWGRGQGRCGRGQDCELRSASCTIHRPPSTGRDMPKVLALGLRPVIKILTLDTGKRRPYSPNWQFFDIFPEHFSRLFSRGPRGPGGGRRGPADAVAYGKWSRALASLGVPRAHGPSKSKPQTPPPSSLPRPGRGPQKRRKTASSRAGAFSRRASKQGEAGESSRRSPPAAGSPCPLPSCPPQPLPPP